MRSAPPIRSKVLRILLVPLVSLVALWGYIAFTMVSETSGIAQGTSRWDVVGAPTRNLITEIQRERQLSAQLAGRTAGEARIENQRQRTDVTVTRIRDVAASVSLEKEAGTPPEVVKELLTTVDGLPALRTAADQGIAEPLETTKGFDTIIHVANKQFGNTSTISNVTSFRVLRGLSDYGAAAEFLARESAVLTPVLARGRMSEAEHTAFVTAMTSRRMALANSQRDIGPDLTAAHRQLVATPAYQRMEKAEDAVNGWDLRGKPPVLADAWQRDADATFAGLNGNTDRDLRRAMLKGKNLVVDGLLRIGLVLGLGLLAVIVSIVLSYRFGRSMINELKRLQGSAVELAEVGLPKLVERLRRGEDVAPAEPPEPEPARTAEVERVAQAFSAVQRTAVEAAIGQATLRKGVGQVFLNLARRNQALLHRQLSLLDTMERKVDDPETLEGLFKLDHFTTRMRRHAENLIILSDAAPGRRWRDPVPLYDVVRSSVLEVEDYTRIAMQEMPHAPLLLGGAVTDVIHLLAELVENATVFSPPNTAVQVRGLSAANGYALEVEDRGLGMNSSTMAELNELLATPPEFDLASSDRMGLFVVSRLAARHGIRVLLRPSPYDGTTAIVMLPLTLLAEPAAPQRPVSLFDATRSYASTGANAGPAMRTLGADPPAFSPQPSPPLTDSDDDLDGLPVRVRQASIAPQLRKPHTRNERDVTSRSPEELHDLMSTMQQGWRQGRKECEGNGDARNGRDPHGRPEI